ncbi:MAG: hexosaminidase [Solirubrobacteraceae bacterium]|jgi:PKD repeat protein|nr:hexosaminidase [Solirubrobacteraceae bacterium]
MSARAVAVLTALTLGAIPAAASAATWTVDPLRPNTGACDPGTGACKTIHQADTAAKDGDTIVIKDATYAEAPLVFTQKNLTVKAEHPGQVRITIGAGQAGDSVITIGPGGGGTPDGTGDGAKLEGLIVVAPTTGGPAVEINARSAILRLSTFDHPNASSDSAADRPVVEVDPDIASGTTQLLNDFVAQHAGTTGAVTAGSLLVISDSVITTTHGYAVRYDGGASPGDASTLLRSKAITADPKGNAVEVASGTEATRVTLRIDSSILSGGEQGASLYAQPAKFVDTTSQDILVSAVRTTVAGAAQAAVADAEPVTGQLLFAPGDVFIAFDRSIVHGGAKALSGMAAAPNGGSSTASIDIVRSDTDVEPSAHVTVAGSSTSTDAQLFLDPAGRNYHLRGNAPVIDQGGIPEGGESDRDVDGEARVIGVASDLGADEFLNHAPVARFTPNATTISQNQSITFDAADSNDPDAGDRVARYRWDFGDGSTEGTDGAQITHTYARVGTYQVTLIVLDSHGFVSGPQTVSVAVRSAKSLRGTRPQISITRPRSRQRIPRSVRLVIAGRATDESGIRRVQLSLRLVKRAKGHSSASQCLFVKRSSITRKACSRPPLLSATLSGRTWRWRAPRSLHLPPGLYVARVRATDKTGVASRTAVRTFRIR